MVQIIQINKDELHATLSEIVRKTFLSVQKEVKTPVLSDRITDIKEVEDLTGLKRSVLYKKTANGEIPCAHFGKKLIFSRKEIISWIEDKTIKKANPDELMTSQLAKVANKKSCKHGK